MSALKTAGDALTRRVHGVTEPLGLQIAFFRYWFAAHTAYKAAQRGKLIEPKSMTIKLVGFGKQPLSMESFSALSSVCHSVTNLYTNRWLWAGHQLAESEGKRNTLRITFIRRSFAPLPANFYPDKPKPPSPVAALLAWPLERMVSALK